MLKPRRLLPTSFYRVSRTVADYSACRQHPYGFYQTRAPSTALYIRSATAAVDKTNAVFTFARFIPILLCSLEAVQTGTYKFPSCQKLSYRRHNASCITNSTNILENYSGTYKHQVVFSLMQRFALLPQGRPQVTKI